MVRAAWCALLDREAVDSDERRSVQTMAKVTRLRASDPAEKIRSTNRAFSRAGASLGEGDSRAPFKHQSDVSRYSASEGMVLIPVPFPREAGDLPLLVREAMRSRGTKPRPASTTIVQTGLGRRSRQCSTATF